MSNLTCGQSARFKKKSSFPLYLPGRDKSAAAAVKRENANAGDLTRRFRWRGRFKDQATPRSWDLSLLSWFPLRCCSGRALGSQDWSGDADEARAGRIDDGVDSAILENTRLSAVYAIGPRLFDLCFAGDRAVVRAIPLGHFGMFNRLAVNRPRLTVIVRSAGVVPIHDMRQDLAAQLRILIK